MKKTFLLFGAIFMLAGFAAHGQVYEMYSQGFEGSGSTYTVSPSAQATVVSDMAASGSSSLKLVQLSATGDVELMLDTLDFTTMTQLSYIALEFDHINNIYPNGNGDVEIGQIWYKRASQSDAQWSQAQGTTEYNRADEYSTEFVTTSTFSRNSYSIWKRSTMGNDCWRHERFDFNSVFGNVATSDRKLLIKFVLKANTTAAGVGATGWWLDNIKVKASASAMVKPQVKMHLYPDAGAYPNSRGARIELDAYTTVSEGICADSVYLLYTIGSDATEHRLPMSYMRQVTNYADNTQWGRYGAMIPFEGYDTVMSFRCVVKDNTTNFNEATFPTSEGATIEYWCIRGTEQLGVRTESMTGTTNFSNFPFPATADGMSQWVFDSAFMAAAGYGPGAITDLRFMVGAASQASTRQQFQFRMRNAPTSFTINDNNKKFTEDFLHVTLDTTLVLPAMAAGSEFTISLPDTFFYAGQDLVMQAIYNGGTSDPTAVSIKVINAPSNKQTIYLFDMNGGYNANPYLEYATFMTDIQAKRPAIAMTQHANKPLYYDMGIGRVSFPTYDDPIVNQPATMTAMLHNYGVNTINAVRVTWTIDDTIWGYTDWTGSIAGGDSANINIGSVSGLPAGYHYLRTWVEDTLTVTAGNLHVRDHEPFNDTAYTEFIACAGPLSGVRQIGGDEADYNNIEEFLFSLSRCGIDDSLVVRLAPGCYPPFAMTSVNGLTEQHYIVYESLDEAQRATLYADAATGTAQIVDISEVANIRFRNLNFVRRGGSLSNMVTMGSASHNCRFEGCRFVDSVENPVAAIRISSMLNNAQANNMKVDGCTFEGGLVGVTMAGLSTVSRSSGCSVTNSLFRNQYNRAVDVQYVNGITIDHNEMYDVLTNNSYVLQLMYVGGTVAVTGNRILTTNGAGGIGISEMAGTQTNHAIVANNMIVCDDAVGNHTLATPLNVIKAEWTDVVYNAVKLTATSRSNVAAVTFGGTLIDHCRFVNNIVACMDNRNYALSYQPGGVTTNTVSNNVYYGLGNTLNRYAGTGYGSLEMWVQAVPGDTLSVVANPVFLNGTEVDLRTFNRALKGLGTPIAEVTVDIYDSVRSTTAPCPGAFEFSSLAYDFEVEAMLSPVADTCDMPDQVELVVRMRNGGTSPYNPDSTVTLTMSYTVNGGTVHTFAMPQAIPAEDTVSVHTGQMLQLPPDGILDAVYDIKVWISCANDPNQTNDTNTFRSVSRYQVTAPEDVESTTLYMTPDTVTISNGVNQWQVYADPSAPKVPSVIYWYHDLDEEEPFLEGNTLITTPLRQDTQFYVRQQREVPMVRLTQVMIKGTSTTTGLASPLPDWMNSGTQVAVQLTNVGDDTAYLGGDTLRIVSPNSNYNNKGTLKFDNSVVLAPGQAIVVQYVSGNSTNAAKTVHTKTKITPPITADLGFIYRNGTVIDAVAINSVVTATSNQSIKWSTQNVPSYVWSGTAGVTATSAAAAGFVRSLFNGNASDWALATDARPVRLDWVDQDWIQYSQNGCGGGAALVTVTISNKPTSDIDLEAYPLASGCGLGVEPLTVRVRNYGDSAVAALQLNYTLGGDTVSETMTSPVPSFGDTTYTFAQSPNLAFDVDSTVNITIWATAVVGDIEHGNDTTWVSTVSLHTLAAPAIDTTIAAEYGESTTVALDFPSNVMPVWYDYDMNPADTGYTYQTDVLYTEGNIGVSYIAKEDVVGRIGLSGTVYGNSNKTNYPSPFQPNMKYVKQQFIYSAHELRNIGLDEGQISRLAFHLDSIYGTRDSILFDKYYLSLGMTPDSTFANVTAWKTTTIVKEIDSLVIRRSDVRNWVWFDLDEMFMWDGESSLVVEVAYALSNKVTTGVTTAYTAKTGTTLHKAKDNAADLSPSVHEFAGSGGSKGNNRPDIMISGSAYGCNGPITQIPMTLVNVPEHDATIYWPDGSDTASYVSCLYTVPSVTVFNLGSEPISGYDLYYWLDADTIPDTTHRTDVIAAGQTIEVPLFSRYIQPGRHSVRAVISSVGDTISRNDTIEGMITVRFCGGQYTIKADSTGDFASFGAAIDTLNVVGTNGPLSFLVYPGTYNEQVSVNAATGLTGISFIGVSSGDDVARLVANTSVQNNYVMKIDGVSNVTVDGLQMEARPQVASVKAANVLVIGNGNGIMVRGNRFKVKGSIIDANASCLVLGDSINQLSVFNNTFDSGYCAIRSTGAGYQDFYISGNTFSNFQNKGIDLSGVTKLTIESNTMRAGAGTDGKGLIGINLSYIDSTLSIATNKIYLVDDHTGAKRGIHLEHVTGSEMEMATIVNNMIGLHGTGAAGLTPKNPSGIYLDNGCTNINVLYNTVRVYSGSNNADGRAFYSGTTNSNLQVMDNLFANFSNGHAYYVAGASSILMSDYNGYYSAATNKLAFWGSEKASLALLQTANFMDENSVQDMPYFVGNDDLHLLMTNFCAKAQYNSDVMYDIDGTPRPPIGGTTIGAHELERFTRNMTVVQISKPTVPLNLNNPTNIEGDSILVVASFYNNGSSIENDVSWYAYVESQPTAMVSITKSLGAFNPGEMKTDSVWIPSILGVIDTQVVRVVVLCDGDEDTSDNELTASVYLAPAYNIEAVKIQSGSTGCELTNAVLTFTVKNVGFKEIPMGVSMQISYVAQGYYPAFVANNPDSNKLAIATMPTSPVTETVTFETALPKNQTRAFTFATPANLYPTDTSLNIKVRIKGWLNYQYDILNDNDTTGAATSSSPVVDAYYTPRPPVGHDTTFNYGTWGQVRAEQENLRPIRWYRDSTATPFYTTTGANAYANSCWWSTTPQYFHDSTYYLQCYSDKNCPSHFSAVHVNVGDRLANDMAIEEVLAPVAGRVYMEDDTVRIRIANYGTQSQSNFPVTYEVRKGNNTAPFQTVTETVTATIAPNQTYVYTFDSLVVFANTSPATQPTAGGTYQLRAWTDLSTDQSRRNDTIRTKQQLRASANNDTQLDYVFTAKPESTYPTRTNQASDSVDIIRFSFNEIDVDLPPLGRSYSNFGVFASPEIPVLHVTRGMTDSVFMMITNPEDQNAVERGRIAVYIDFNRNGSFTDPGECVIPDTNLWNNRLYRGQITIPDDASFGYMKMRVSASPYNKVPSTTLTGQDGHMLDFLLFVDRQAPTKDLALTQIAEPRDYLILDGDETKTVSFRIANRGATPINSVEIFYSFTPDGEGEQPVSGSTNWTGNLQPGTSTLVELPTHTFPIGTTTVSIWHELSGDEVASNNSLTYEYHRFHTVVLTLDDNFDEQAYWYAPKGNNGYNRNYWQCGTPTKTKINAPFSAPNAWVTDLTSPVQSGLRGNISYLYSPIIDIAQVRPDTIAFRMIRNLTGGSSVYIEYRNYAGDWVNMTPDTVPPSWYNNTEDKCFDGSSANNAGYTRYHMASSVVSGNFQEKFQFRIVYRTPQGSNANASYGEGCAIDDFRIGRARKPTDVGVVAITKPTAPKYGQTIYPEVLVRNYGTDTIRQLQLGYTHYGTFLAKETLFTGIALPPDAVDTFLFDSPFVITSDFPESFDITAFTINPADIFKDNDTNTKRFHLTQLDNDISASAIITPLDRVIAGDSITVTMRVQNFGLNPISEAAMTYIVSGHERVDESVDFEDALGRPLESMEYFNYTFRQKFRAAMGVMKITCITKDDANEYIYNDTISKRFTGISSIMDLAAAAVVVDTTSSYTDVRVSIVVDNRGARGANDFEVGFWVDDDTAGAVRETYHTNNPLPALSRGYHLFEAVLPPRATPYDRITAFVNIEGDNDLSNDTTTEFMTQHIDLEAIDVMVEENSAADCRVFVRLQNVGNMALVGSTLHASVTVNGNDLGFDLVRRFDPMQVVTYELDRTIPKSPTRQYSGSFSFEVAGDSDPTNNQTSLVRVVNYVEGMPTVGEPDRLELEQNYPNPFTHRTTVPFSLPQGANVRFFVMDATGHIVNSFSGFYPAGPNSVTLDMQSYASGVYYYGIEVDGERQMRKMILR